MTFEGGASRIVAPLFFISRREWVRRITRSNIPDYPAFGQSLGRSGKVPDKISRKADFSWADR